MTPMTTGDILDAVALLRAYLAGDLQAQRVLCENGNQPAMLTALVSLSAGMLSRTPADEAILEDYLEGLAARFLAAVTP